MAVITISRQTGSGGDEIAARVCDLLGYRYFDKQVMLEAAAAAGLCEAEVVDFSEDHYKVRDFLSRLLRSRPRTVRQVLFREEEHKLIDTLTAHDMDEARCADLVRYAISSAYEQGDIVIVGRGGQAVLHNKPGVLHVRIIAPRPQRIALVQERCNVTAEVAAARVDASDRARAAYLRRHQDAAWDDPALYDLIINMAHLDMPTAVDLICLAAQRR